MTTPARPSPFTQLVSTQDWEWLLSAAGIPDGVDGTQSIGQCVPSLDTVGRNAVIGPGNVIIKGQLWSCSASVSTAIPGPSAQNRIDMLVMQYNRGATTAATVIQPVVISGAPSSSPAPPALTQTPTGLFQIPICTWTSTSAGALTGLTDIRQFSVDTWHDLRPASAGWSGSVSGEYPPQYRMSKGHNVELFGIIQLSNPYTGIQVFANPLPTPYRPGKEVRTPITLLGVGTTNMSTTPCLRVLANGTIFFANFPNGLAGTNAFINGSYALDASGLIQV